MPNWASNNLRVTGPAAEIARFIDKAKSYRWYQWGYGPLKTDAEIIMAELEVSKDNNIDDNTPVGPHGLLNFDAFVPIPDDIIKMGYSDAGYHWCASNWSTKWNACEVIQEITPRGVSYAFDTAWSPPYSVVETMSQQFPKLRFILEAREESEGKLPTTRWKGGIIIKGERV